MAVLIRKLTDEESKQAFRRRGQMDVSSYITALAELGQGESAAVALAGLSSSAMKRRLGQAAKQMGYRLKWARVSLDGELYFQVLGQSESGHANGRRKKPRVAAAGHSEPVPAESPQRLRRRRRAAVDRI